MNDTSEYAANVRNMYYAQILKKMGKNVHIGAGLDMDEGSAVVKPIHFYSVSLGNA